MRLWVGLACSAAALALSGAASAADVDIRYAAVRVIVIPEARSDVAVSVVRSNPRMRITVARLGDSVVVNGGLGLRGANCTSFFGRRGVHVWGMGFIPYDDLPQIVVRTPVDAKVRAGGAVFGIVDRTQSLDLANAGCGDWSVANVAGPFTLRLSGSGDVRGGSAGSADVKISGSSDVYLQDIHNGLDSSISGSGDLHTASVSGPMHVRVAGSGDVIAPAGQVTDLVVSVAGSGDVRLGGVAKTLEASVAGSGDVSVGRVTGSVSKHIAGSGSVSVGS